MDNVKTYVSNNRTFYNLDDIKEQKLNVDYFTGCKSMKKCIKRQKIPDDKIVYMKNNKEYDAGYKLASVYVEEDYVRNHILNKEEQTKKKEEEMKQRKEKRIEENKKRKEFNENEVEEAPDILHLEDKEMFKDEEGVVMDIETRGEKTQDGIFFKATDIGKAFDYENVCITVLEVKGNYQHGKDFKYFKIMKDQKNSLDFKNVLYLTYDGVLKVLFCARGDRGVRFRKWAPRILFTMQMGSQEDKDSLAAEALGVEHKTVVNTFRKACGPVSCVYLFCIGRVGDMRKHFNMEGFTNDDDYVYKYGMTSDMGRRTKEHFNKYGKLKDNTFVLKYYAYIDKLYVSKAETHMKQYYMGFNMCVKDDKNVELIVIDNERLPIIQQLYSDMYMQYSGQNSDLIKKLQDIQHERQIEQLQHKYDLQEAKMLYLTKINEFYEKHSKVIM
uniref:Bro-N domain-containing protein n=1 Tax=Pyramimonas orientalis virus TaxID=455367 RepID=A0A7M3UP69_POV01|nr:hypothetical protein HWQ62_00405 [Pyramimonas orientalis virus]